MDLRSVDFIARPPTESHTLAIDAPGEQKFQKLLNMATSPQSEADDAIMKFVSGDNVNVHQVVLAAAKADLTFRFLLEIRNRLTEAYQEIMRLQL